MRPIALFLVFTACGPGEIAPVGGDGGDDTATPTTGPGTTPTDTDTDTDTDTQGGTTTTSADSRVFDAAHVLVLPTGKGVQFMDNTGALVGQLGWTDLVGPCNACTGEGASADGDGLLVSWQATAGDAGIGRVNSSGTLDWKIQGLAFPHDAVREPYDDSVIVPEAFANHVAWYQGDGSSSQPIRALDDHDAGYDQPLPSGIDQFRAADGSVFLALNNRGGFPDGGMISMWDVTDPDAPLALWTFPSKGDLDTPHGAVIRQYDGHFWLLWAHSYGAPNGGSVGVAMTDDLRVPPDYVADLVPAAPIGPLDFVRGVELTSDGWLWITDSGPERSPDAEGRVIKAPLPALSPTGASGAVDSDQVLADLPDAEVVLDGLDNPFEGWLWVPTIAF